MMPIALAELKIDEIKFYVNNERYYDADKGGGDDIKVKKGNTLEVMVGLDNDVNTTTQARLRGIINNINDGSDIIKWQPSETGWYDISANDDQTKTLSFTIPSNAIRDEYDMELIVYYKYSNGTENSFSKIDWMVVVVGDELKPITMEEALSNVSTMCNLLMGKMAASFEYIGKYDGCSSNLSTCREERGKYESQSSECERTKTQYGTDKASCEQDKKECEEKMTQMVSTNDCKTRTDTEVETKVREAEKKKDNTMFGFGLFGGAIALIVYFKKKKGGSVHDKIYEKKMMP